MTDIFQKEFNNEYGEHYIFEYDLKNHTATLRGDETDWEKIPVVDGYPVGFIINEQEKNILLKFWLQLLFEFKIPSLYNDKNTQFAFDKKNCYLENSYCPLCLKQKKDFEIHHCIWSIGGGTSDYFNLLKICKSCHVIITHGSKDDKFLLNDAVFYHQQYYFGINFFPKKNPAKGRHQHVNYLDNNPQIKKLIDNFSTFTNDFQFTVDEKLKKDGRIFYQLFRDIYLGKWPYDQNFIKQFTMITEEYFLTDGDK